MENQEDKNEINNLVPENKNEIPNFNQKEKSQPSHFDQVNDTQFNDFDPEEERKLEELEDLLIIEKTSCFSFGDLELWFLFIALLIFSFFVVFFVYSALKEIGVDTISNPPQQIAELLSSSLYDEQFPFLPADIPKLEAIKEEMKFAWKEYETHSWGSDFHRPTSITSNIHFNGGITIIDSIDTLYLMNLTEEYNHAREWILTNFSLEDTGTYSFFEIVIREFGGLLSIYQLTNDSLYLEKAKLIADSISKVFLPNGFFFNALKFKNKTISRLKIANTIADLGTIQLEFDTLGYLTKNINYSLIGSKAHKTLFQLYCHEFIYPIVFNTCKTSAVNKLLTFDVAADSFYEYLIKLYILSGGTSKIYLKRYIEAMKLFKSKFISFFPKKNIFHVLSYKYQKIDTQMSHLMAYIGATLVIGSVQQNPFKKEDFDYAEKLTMSFVKLYESYKTGLML